MASAPVPVEFIHGARVQKQGIGSGDQDPSKFLLTSFNVNTIFWPPCPISILDKAHACSRLKCFYVFIENAIISKFPFQINIYTTTRMIDSKFEIPNKFRRGAHRAPSSDPFLALSRALLLIRALPDSDPLLLTRGCALTMPGDAICKC